MELQDVLTNAIRPAMLILGIKDTPEADVQLLTIGLQESRFQFRKQMGNGPARSFWQFERGGGVRGVLAHPASKDKAKLLCAARSVNPDEMSVWQAMETDDTLGAGFARLLLWTDPKALPSVDDDAGGWATYQRNWRPGKPHPETWNAYHQQARMCVVGR